MYSYSQISNIENAKYLLFLSFGCSLFRLATVDQICMFDFDLDTVIMTCIKLDIT